EWDGSQGLRRAVRNCWASGEGHGKPRFCADLARRIYHGLPWPDGTPATLPKGSTTLWVPSDNQHGELASLPTAFGFPPEALYLNAPASQPFGGTALDYLEDLRAFEARIKRVKPGLVIINTINNTTDRATHKAEEAKRFFVPLQQIAARTRTCCNGTKK